MTALKVDPAALTVKTPVATAAYAFVFEARPSLNPGGEPQFSIMLIFPKSTDLSQLKAAAHAAVAKKWGDKPPKDLRSPFRDGDVEREGSPEFTNSYFVTAKSKQRPGIVDNNPNGVQSITDPMQFYSGCKCRASLYAFAYDVSGSRGVSFLLNSLQKLGDGERRSGRKPAEVEFEPIAIPEDAANAAAATNDLF
jgi:Protein of unknown function (DUF2815)